MKGHDKSYSTIKPSLYKAIIKSSLCKAIIKPRLRKATRFLLYRAPTCSTYFVAAGLLARKSLCCPIQTQSVSVSATKFYTWTIHCFIEIQSPEGGMLPVVSEYLRLYPYWFITKRSLHKAINGISIQHSTSNAIRRERLQLKFARQFKLSVMFIHIKALSAQTHQNTFTDVFFKKGRLHCQCVMLLCVRIEPETLNCFVFYYLHYYIGAWGSVVVKALRY